MKIDVEYLDDPTPKIQSYERLVNYSTPFVCTENNQGLQNK
jgi:hypothetical protein